MPKHSWIRTLFTRPNIRPIRKAWRRSRLAVETLEARTVPATFTVTNNADDGSVGSLRWAVGQADTNPGADVINFDPTFFGTQRTILLTGTQLTLSDTATTTITGPGANLLSVSGNNASQVFVINSGTSATISGLTITDGHVTGKGGGVSNSGTLTMTDCTISGSSASSQGGGLANYSGGVATLTDCTVSGNTASFQGAGIQNSGTMTITSSTITANSGASAGGGGINTQGPSLTVVNSTIASNSAGGSGGGIAANQTVTLTGCTVSGNTGSTGGGILEYSSAMTLTNCTVTGNHGTSGGGVYMRFGSLYLVDATISSNTATSGGGISNTSGTGGLKFRNSIVSANSAPTGPDINGVLSTDKGHNLLGTALSGTATGPGDVFNDTPLLAPLADNGGPTQTMALEPGSPAIGTGDSTEGGKGDQRGVTRPAVGTDIGAVQNTLLVNTTADIDHGNITGPTVSLRDTITAANTAPGTTIILFDSSLAGQAIILAGTVLPTISANVTITGLGADQLTISGNNQSEILNVGSDAIVGISGLNLIDGLGTFGGAVYSQGVFSATDCKFADNAAPTGLGGAVYNRAEGSDPLTGVMTLTDDTFFNNSATDSGAIDNWAGGNVVVNGDTFDGNTAQSGGAILNEWGSVEVTNSTFFGNTATILGGAIHNGSLSGNSLQVIDSTITGNSSVTAGGIEAQSGQTLILQNTIVAGNAATSATDIDGSITNDNGHNLLGTALNGTTFGAGDVFSDTPLLAPLGNYGGPTQTMALELGSPAVNAGNNTGGPSTDQRGFSRPTGAGGDIGAFETSVFVITSTADTGAGSLRNAITSANAIPGASVVSFDITGVGPFIIAPLSTLPAVTASLTIDGATQPGYTGVPLIELLGTSAGAGVNGLTLQAGHSIVRGLDIVGFAGDGILITGPSATANTIAGNYIGVDPNGNTPHANGGNGVEIGSGANGNTVGGLAATPGVGAGNIITGNSGFSIQVDLGTSTNTILGNLIGLTAAGNSLGPTPGEGIDILGASGTIIGGSGTGSANVISGFAGNGISLRPGTSGTVIQGNFIGTNPTGLLARGNSTGIFMDTATSTTIGGSAAGTGNIVSGNSNGINVTNSSSTTVQGNVIGLKLGGLAALANTQNGLVIVNSTGTIVGGTTASDRNVISGNSGAGVYIQGAPASGDVVIGNYIGTNVTGTAAVGNANGVQIDQGANGNIIGGGAAGDRNVISGNTNEGIFITGSGTSGNKVEGNYIGADATGMVAVANGAAGVFISLGAASNQIGGDGSSPAVDLADRNVISGNIGQAVFITDPGTNSNRVAGNYVGVDMSGEAVLGNHGSQIVINNGAAFNVIGTNGTAADNAGQRNVISGGLIDGVKIEVNSVNNLVAGNDIGLDAAGVRALGNGSFGVEIYGGSNSNFIGDNGVGPPSAMRNVISGNVGGISIHDVGTSLNVVAGNYIGTNAPGTAAVANTGDGILVNAGATNNTIGGTAAGAGNVIAFNTQDGVGVSGATTTGNPIRANSIYGNGGLGINLSGTGNNDQAFPVVIAAAVDSSGSVLDPFARTTQIKATFTGGPSTTYQLDVFDNATAADPSGFGQGRNYLGTTTITTDASGNPTPGSSTFFDVLNATLPAGDILTITATDPSGNTSQFSNDVTSILRPEIILTGLPTSVRGQLAPYTITPGVSATDLASGGVTYAINWGDGNQEIDNSTLANFVVRHIFLATQPPNTPYQVQVAIQDQYGFTGLTQTFSTQVNAFALEANNTEIDVGGQIGGSAFQLTGVLSTTNTALDTFNLNVDGGSANATNGGITINHLDPEFTPAVLSSLTKFVLWGQNAPTGLGNIFDAGAYVGTVDIHNGPGNNTLVGSATGVNNFNYIAHATDNLLIIAPPTATNTLSFVGSDQGITFSLGDLNGQVQQVTPTGDMLAIEGSVPVVGLPTTTGAINAYVASDMGDTVTIPSGYTTTYTPTKNLTLTGGGGNDTFTISPIVDSAGNNTFQIANTNFAGGAGNDAFQVGTSAGTSNDTFQIQNSTFLGGAGNDTFLIGNNASVANNTFTISGATFDAGPGNDSFQIAAGSGNDTFTINNSSFGGSGANDTFQISTATNIGAGAGAANDTFQIASCSFNTGAGNDTFTIGSPGATNATFQIANSSFNTGSGNDTFTINGNVGLTAGSNVFQIGSSLAAGNDSFTINGSLTTSAGNDTFVVQSSPSANDTFMIANGVNLGAAGNDTFEIGSVGAGTNTFTINGGVTGGAGNDTFQIGNAASAGNDTFQINGAVSLGAGNDTFIMQGGSNAGSNAAFSIANGVSGGSGNDTFLINSPSPTAGNDTFTINSNFAGGAGNDTFLIQNPSTAGGNTVFTLNGSFISGPGNDAFQILGGAGASNDTFQIGTIDASASVNTTFQIGSAGTGNDTFTLGNIAAGIGNDTFTIGNTGAGNDTFTIGSVTAGSAAAGVASNGTFTIGSFGTGNDTFAMGNISVAAGAGNDTFTIGSQATGSATFQIGVLTATGAGNDTFQIGSFGAGDDTFTMGGINAVANSGNETFQIGSFGAGNDSFTMNGSITAGTGNDTFQILGGAAGNDTFIITSGVNAGASLGTDNFQLGSAGAGNDTFQISNLVGGAGNNTFILSQGGSGNDTFTINHGISGAGNDTFVLSNSGTTIGNSTFTVNSSFTGGAGNDHFFLQDPGTGASNDTFLINGDVTDGGGNDTFVISNTSAGNTTFTINGNIAAGAGNDTFTINNTGVGANDTFTINGTVQYGVGVGTFILSNSGAGNDKFTIAGGIRGAGNDTFVVNSAGAAAGNDSFTINSNLVGGPGNDEFFVQDSGSGAGNDTVIVNGNLTAVGRNAVFFLTNNAAGNDTFVVNGAITGGGGNGSFEINNAGNGSDSFTIVGGLHDSGSASDAFTLSNTGNGNDSFAISGGVTFGSGQDEFSVNALGNGSDSYTINGNVTLGNGNDTFFTSALEGTGNQSFTVNGGVSAGDGSDFFTLGAAGAGNNVFTITGPVAFGAGADSIQLNGSGTGNVTFNLTGGVGGQGYDTITINDPGAVNGNESFTVNGNLGGGQGNSTFLVTSGLNYFNGSDTYVQNGNLIGGAGFNTFSLADSNHAGNSFTLNGSLIGGANDTDDSFDLAGTYGALHLVSGTGTGADTYEFTGSLQASVQITAPDQTSRVDLLDFSSLNSAIAVDLGQTAAQTVAPGLVLQLSDANGITSVVGTAFGDTIHGNARSDALTGAQSLDSSYNPTAPGVGANGKVQVVLLDFDTAYQAADGVFDFNSYYGRAGITPLHVYSMAERQAILQEIENDYAPFLFVPGQSSGGIYFTLSAADARAKAQIYTGSATQFITEYFDQSIGAGGDEPSPGGPPPGVPATPQFEPGGTSSDLDFRDADMTGTASIQVNGILGEPLMPPATEQNWIAMSAKIGAHELGHLLGLHHEDSFGPIGQGIMPLPNGGNYNPPYPGPYDASETFDNIMTSGDSVGADRWNDLRTLDFNEREDIVLALAFAAPTMPADGTLLVPQHGGNTAALSPQAVALQPLSVPNTVAYGANAGLTYEVQAVDVEGQIGLDPTTNQAQSNYYSFTGNQNDLINIDVWSTEISRDKNQGSSGYIDATVYLYYRDPSTGQLTQVDYYNIPAFNDDTYQSSDSQLVDVYLPKSGTYVVKVASFSYAAAGIAPPTQSEIAGLPTPEEQQDVEDAVNGTDTGNYELFIYRFKAGMTTSGANTFYAGAGGGTITGAGSNNTLIVDPDVDMVLTNTGLTYSDGTTFALNNVQNANLTIGPNAHQIDVSGWTGGGSLTASNGNGTLVIDNSVSGFTLTNGSAQSTDGMNLSLFGYDNAILTGSNFNIAGWTGTDTINGPGGTAISTPLGQDFNGIAGDSIDQEPVATFSDPNGSPAAGTYSASINWGDQTASAGMVNITGNVVTILGAHGYANAGSYSVTVTLREGSAFSVVVTSLAAIAPSAKTTTAVVSSATNDSSIYGQATTFTATVTPDASGSPMPTGSVQFVDSTTGQMLGTYALVNGQASVTLSTLVAESHAIEANYVDETGGYSASFGMLTHIVNPFVFTYQIGSDSQKYGSAANLGNDLVATINTGVFGQSLAISYVSTGDNATADVKAGGYAILATLANGTGLMSNYTVTLVAGTLTVNPFTFSHAIGSASQTYGSPANLPSALGTTIVTGVNGQNLAITYSSTGDAAAAVVGAYPITGVLSNGTGKLSDYSVTLTNGTLTVGAVAGSVYILDPMAGGALSVSGNASIKTTGNVVVDSNSATAVQASGNASVSAPSVQVVGHVSTSGNATVKTLTGAPGATGDPMGGLAIPVANLLGLSSQASVNVSGNASQTINPGIYKQIAVSGNGRLTLCPGIYIIEGGGFTVSGNGSVSGAGVMIYNSASTYNPATGADGSGGTFGGFTLSGNGTFSISAPTSGTYAGILLFQDRNNAQALSLSGNGMLGTNGTIYAEKAQLLLSGNAQLTDTLIVDRLSVSGNGQANGLAAPAGTVVYSPAQVRTAYGVAGLGNLATPLDGTGQTIAIVDAYDNPAINGALDAFDSQFGTAYSGPSLYDQYGPASTFVTVLNQDGQPTSLPPTDPTGQGGDNWEVEESLDVEWAHAMAPGARIILVEANSQSLSDLLTAVATAAAQPGVSVVSMSWGFVEGQDVLQSDEAKYDSYFTTPGVTFVASTGDYGAADPEYPAYSPNVLAVGGTSLLLNQDQSYQSETGWGYSSAAYGAFIGAGGGISQFEPEPAFQANVQSTGNRTTPDVSFVADPATGAWVADPYNQTGDSPFEAVGGTSLSAPCWAGLMALANQGRAAASESSFDSTSPTETQQALYALPQADYHGITSGFNGYNAGTGYNLVTGLGTPAANLLVPDLIAWSGPGSVYAGSRVGALQSANLVYTGAPVGGPTNVMNVFDALPVASGANVERPTVLQLVTPAVTARNLDAGHAAGQLLLMAGISSSSTTDAAVSNFDQMLNWLPISLGTLDSSAATANGGQLLRLPNGLDEAREDMRLPSASKDVRGDSFEQLPRSTTPDALLADLEDTETELLERPESNPAWDESTPASD